MEQLYQSRYSGPEIDRRLGLMAGNFLWIKWSAAFPVVEMLDEPGPYIGIYTGESNDPPDDPAEYKWYLNSGADGQPGPEGPEGPVGPPNTLAIGTVQSGVAAAATITGEAPEQTLNLVLPKGETGAGLDILGTYPTVEALEAAVTSPAQGDMYNVGLAAPFNVYMWDVELNDWIDQGVLQGPPGPDGADGKSGVFFGPVEDAPEDAIVVVDPAGAVFTTDNVPEGQTNLYYTDARVDQRIAESTTFAPIVHDHGAITHDGKVGAVAGLPLFTGEGGAVGTKTAAEARTALGVSTAPAKLAALPTSGTALVDNAEYRVSATVGAYVFAWPTSPFEAWIRFSTAATFNITFPTGTTYIGGAPTFKANTAYEMSVKDGVVIVQEIVA